MFSALIASLVISSISFVGILILTKKLQDIHTFLTLCIAFAAGTMIGDVFWHLLPEFLEQYTLGEGAITALLLGITAMLVVEAYFHCSHDSHKHLDHGEHDHAKAHLAPINLIGDGVHNFLDGLAIGASFLVGFDVGVAATIAIAFHEIPQEFADVSVMRYAGWERKKILMLNFLTGLTSIIGVICIYLFAQYFPNATYYIVPFAIGQFIYIALADLIPEIHEKFGVQKYILEISTFIGGLILMYLLRFILK